MDTDALPAALQQPLVLRAVEELQMVTQTDEEREQTNWPTNCSHQVRK
jgi:hypothetical protein